MKPSVPLATEGLAAPPRRNGELVFDAPWESRVFGVTMALHARGLFEWDEFRELLIDEIRAWEADGAPRQGWSYYARGQAALERLLIRRGLVGEADLDARAASLAERPAGHDHPADDGTSS